MSTKKSINVEKLTDKIMDSSSKSGELIGKFVNKYGKSGSIIIISVSFAVLFGIGMFVVSLLKNSFKK